MGNVPPEPGWTEWGAWGPCSRSCGRSGKRVRRRSCRGAGSRPCPGRASEAQRCPRPPCPGNGPGAPSAEPPAGCPGRTLRGTVRTAAGAALPGARVYLEGGPPVPLARSDARGRFTASGLCPGPAANLSAHRDGFAAAWAPIVTDGSGAAAAHLRLRRLGERARGARGAPLGGEPGVPTGSPPLSALCREALHGAAARGQGAGGRAGRDLLLRGLGHPRAPQVLLVPQRDAAGGERRAQPRPPGAAGAGTGAGGHLPLQGQLRGGRHPLGARAAHRAGPGPAELQGRAGAQPGGAAQRVPAGCHRLPLLQRGALPGLAVPRRPRGALGVRGGVGTLLRGAQDGAAAGAVRRCRAAAEGGGRVRLRALCPAPGAGAGPGDGGRHRGAAALRPHLPGGHPGGLHRLPGLLHHRGAARHAAPGGSLRGRPAALGGRRQGAALRPAGRSRVPRGEDAAQEGAGGAGRRPEQRHPPGGGRRPGARRGAAAAGRSLPAAVRGGFQRHRQGQRHLRGPPGRGHGRRRLQRPELRRRRGRDRPPAHLRHVRRGFPRGRQRRGAAGGAGAGADGRGAGADARAPAEDEAVVPEPRERPVGGGGGAAAGRGRPEEEGGEDLPGGQPGDPRAAPLQPGRARGSPLLRQGQGLQQREVQPLRAAGRGGRQPHQPGAAARLPQQPAGLGPLRQRGHGPQRRLPARLLRRPPPRRLHRPADRHAGRRGAGSRGLQPQAQPQRRGGGAALPGQAGLPALGPRGRGAEEDGVPDQRGQTRPQQRGREQRPRLLLPEPAGVRGGAGQRQPPALLPRGGGQVRVQRGALQGERRHLVDRRLPGVVAQPAGVPGVLHQGAAGGAAGVHGEVAERGGHPPPHPGPALRAAGQPERAGPAAGRCLGGLPGVQVRRDALRPGPGRQDPGVRRAAGQLPPHGRQRAPAGLPEPPPAAGRQQPHRGLLHAGPAGPAGPQLRHLHRDGPEPAAGQGNRHRPLLRGHLGRLLEGDAGGRGHGRHLRVPGAAGGQREPLPAPAERPGRGAGRDPQGDGALRAAPRSPRGDGLRLRSPRAHPPDPRRPAETGPAAGSALSPLRAPSPAPLPRPLSPPLLAALIYNARRTGGPRGAGHGARGTAGTWGGGPAAPPEPSLPPLGAQPRAGGAGGAADGIEIKGIKEEVGASRGRGGHGKGVPARCFARCHRRSPGVPAPGAGGTGFTPESHRTGFGFFWEETPRTTRIKLPPLRCHPHPGAGATLAAPRRPGFGRICALFITKYTILVH
uniref:Uncharacterized protein n=1 Tax=Taeniopygia guttata TaxID=59729 RepID=A0A674GVR9_TAEGU